MSLSHLTGAQIAWIAFAVVAGGVVLWRLARSAAYLLAAFGNAEYEISLSQRDDDPGTGDRLTARE